MGRSTINRWRRDSAYCEEQRQKQAHEPPIRTTCARTMPCRVCGKDLAVGEEALMKSLYDGYSHVRCDFWTAAERARRAVAASRRELDRVALLREAVRWLAQTVHQAYHDGSLDDCPKSTCRHAVDVLRRTA